MLSTALPQNKKGWQAMLDLRFQRLHGKTTLTTRHHVGPLTVQRPFYPEEETCHLCLLHPPGGIVGGDELIINAIIDSDCHTLITMPGASKFYRSSGAQAHLQQNLTLCNNATLEWLPQDSIFFPALTPRCIPCFICRPPVHCWPGIFCALDVRSSEKPSATEHSLTVWRYGSTVLRC
ncbi:urease accessory protein ureD [Escherichia coli DEC8B]|nr:urease accessory protein ureD [Escherichia coli DEC8B]